jgi:hypothetical protein
MKPVFSTESELEFQSAFNRLTEAGIPVTEPSNHSEMPGYYVGPRARTLCVWLDHQFDDACLLLGNPNHVVQNPVDWREFNQVQDEVRRQHSDALSKFNERALSWCVGIGALGLVFFGAYRVFR